MPPLLPLAFSSLLRQPQTTLYGPELVYSEQGALVASWLALLAGDHMARFSVGAPDRK